MPATRTAAAPAKPLKRPSQARAQFTVQAIYDAFVRIWQRDGWARLTTRAVALETGISVGTLYDYFPNKQALLSGYVRHCIDALLARVHSDVVLAASDGLLDFVGATWTERLVEACRVPDRSAAVRGLVLNAFAGGAGDNVAVGLLARGLPIPAP